MNEHTADRDDHCSPLYLPRSIELRGGGRAMLRYLREEDAEQICRILPQAHKESDFLLYLPGEFDWPPEREREYIREHKEQPHSILICAEQEERLIALCGAPPMPFRRYAHHAEMGITVFKAHWGQGLGRIMTQHVLDWAGAEGLRKLTLRVFADNVRAISLYRSLGFIEEGRLRGDVFRADGRYSDTILMAKIFVE